jgi:hypothetical protein
MEIYLLKASAILALFLFCYQALLRNETFFTLNRFFLLGGLLASLLLPFATFKEEILVQAMTLNTADTSVQSEVAGAEGMSWKDALLWIYLMGMVFFAGLVVKQLLGIVQIIRKGKTIDQGRHVLIPSRYIKGPFSFFQYIFYNPEAHEEAELHLILEHEKAHGRQWHSLDILLARITAIVLWMNPLAWWYQKFIEQNLEYLADARAAKSVPSLRDYQYALLKVSGNRPAVPLGSPFNQSLIKKRIVMLQRNQSKSIHLAKYLLILPLLALFLMAFNREKVYVMAEGPSALIYPDAGQVVELIIDKNTTDQQLLKMKQDLSKDKVDFSYTTVRNTAGEIIDISLNLIGTAKNGNSFSGSYNADSEDPIKPIMVRITDGGGIFIGEVSAHREMEGGQEFHFRTSGTDKMVWVYKGDEADGEERIEVRDIGGTKAIWINGEEVDPGQMAEDGKAKKIFVKMLETSDDPDVEVKIHKIEVSGDGDREKIIEVTSDQTSGGTYKTFVIDAETAGDSHGMHVINTGGKKPMIFIDGKKASKKEMDELGPDQIESINVLKGEKAVEKHGKKAKDGVIEITTKKG